MRQRRSPVDKGWSWMILLSAAASLLILSIVNVTGVYNVIFLEVFDKDKATTSWIGAIHGCAMFLPGIMSGVLSNRFGARVMFMVGGMLAALGFFLAFFSSTFIQVLLSYGVLAGFGMGIVYIPGITVVGFYFKKYRNLAYGIVTMAVGCGTLLWAVITPLLVECYGWRGCMLLTSGVILNLCVCGALMRPPSLSSLQIENESKDTSAENAADITRPTDDLDLTATNANKSNTNSIEMTANDSQHICQYSPFSSEDTKSPFGDKRYPVNGDTSVNVINTFNKPQDQKRMDETKNEKQNNDLNESNSLIETPQLGASDTNKRNNIQKQTGCNGLCIIQDKGFLLYCLSMFFVCKPYAIVLLHLPAFAVSRGTSPVQAANLLSAIGITSIFGRLIAGAASNHSSFDVSTLYFGSCGLSGIFILLVPALCNTYAMQLVFAALFGIYSNCFVAVMAPMTIDLIGVENLDTAYGIQVFLSGLSYIIGPPMAGWFYDVFQSYEYGFYLAGLEFLLGALLVMAVPVVKYKPSNSSCRREKLRSETNEPIASA